MNTIAKLLAAFAAGAIVWAAIASTFGAEPAASDWKEADYSRALANRLDGTPGHRCADGTLVDVLTAELAIEVEYPEKWAESIGQALHYADQTGRKPAVAYLLRHADSDWRGLVRGSRLCGQLGIRVMVFPVQDLRRNADVPQSTKSEPPPVGPWPHFFDIAPPPPPEAAAGRDE